MSGFNDLPLEILEIIFNLFSDEETLFACSGVNKRWYSCARRCLSSRSNLTLCRWPSSPASETENLCIAGAEALEKFPGRKFKNLKYLKIWFDRPEELRPKQLKHILTNVKRLRQIELLNLSKISQENVEEIIAHCSPGLRLQVCLSSHQDESDVTFLLENRELFGELLVETESAKVCGWYPVNDEDYSFHLRPKVREVHIMQCPGLVHLCLPSYNQIETLKLYNCSSLNDNEIIAISKLWLRKFKISSFSGSESSWRSAFLNGFKKLTSLSIFDCTNVTDSVVEALSSKTLIKLRIELRADASDNSISHLCKINSLEILKIKKDQIMSAEILTIGIKRHWPNLKKLRIEEYLHGYDLSLRAIDSVKNCIKLESNAEFEHFINPTRICDDNAKLDRIN